LFPLAKQENAMSDLRSQAASFMASRKRTSHPQRADSEGTRYSDQRVVFHREFTLGASRESHPPGPYVIETAEEAYATGGHTAHVRKSTLLIVPTPTGTRSIPINVLELEAALKKDAEREQQSSEGESRGTGNAQSALAQSVLQSQLERYGIERVPADVFVWGAYRYTNASDALAAAKRAEKR
jgi:hypothetical protein